MRQHKIDSKEQRAADAAAAAADAISKVLAAEAAPRIAAEQKKNEQECAANSVPVRRGMLSALVVKKASLYREASSQSKAIASLMPGEQVKVEESSPETLASDGQRWGHVETNRLVDCSPHRNITGWLDKAAVVEAKDFKPVNRWNGPARLDVEAGDWVGSYYFAADGTYRSDEYRGKLYQHGDVVMGRAELDGQEMLDVFLWVEGKGICWEFDLTYCQR
ncbi:MAG TPA: hypothetical protein VF471_07375 [Pseudoxanthomonas sp.]